MLENLYYLGNYGVVNINGVIIAGFSKIHHPEYSYLTEFSIENGDTVPYKWNPHRKNDSPKLCSYFHMEVMIAFIDLCNNFEKNDILLLHENPPGNLPNSAKEDN